MIGNRSVSSDKSSIEPGKPQETSKCFKGLWNRPLLNGKDLLLNYCYLCRWHHMAQIFYLRLGKKAFGLFQKEISLPQNLKFMFQMK